jgi:ABC-2 type transport system permease protein
MIAILKREFNSYFYSPVGYVFLFVFFAASGLFFLTGPLYTGVADISSVFSMMFWIMMIIIPVLTMRLLADDRRLKTDQLTLTSPISLTSIVVGKFLSAVVIFSIGVLMILFYAVALSLFTESMNWVGIWGNVLGMMLLGMLFISVGIFVSSLTENQMVAAIGSMLMNFLLFSVELIAAIVPFKFLQEALYSISVFSRYSQITSGIFDFRMILFFVSFIVCFLFLTVRNMERRRWN